MTGKTLEDFRRKHDPKHVVEQPTTVYDRPLPKGVKRFIVTAAQNATPVEPDFWRILSFMSSHLKAERMVIPMRYKNPTSHWSGSQGNAEYWTEEVRPFLWNRRLPLNANLTLLADIKIQPTASAPLTGAEAISLSSSGIVGHTKIQTASVATPQAKMAKIMMTSGACTEPNYTDSRAGRTGEFHHSFSALLVELDGKRFYLRRLHFDKKTKSVTDLGQRYFADRVEAAPPALALVMGDTHVDSIDPKVAKATFGAGGLVSLVHPEILVWHDLLDAYSCNPHHRGKPFTASAKVKAGKGDVQAEVERAIDFVRRHTPKDAKSFVVPSNHDNFLERWIEQGDWKAETTNRVFYLETALAMERGTHMDSGGANVPDPFIYWFEKANVPRSKTLRMDESLFRAGVEMGLHGHLGPNGSRGSIKNLRRLGVKTIIGHSHSPGEDEGCTQVGTSTHLRLEYNKGPSSWLNAHCVLNADGKRQLIIIVDGRFKL